MTPTDYTADRYNDASLSFEHQATELRKTADLHDVTAKLKTPGSPGRPFLREIAHQTRQAAAFADQAAAHLRWASILAADEYDRVNQPF